MNGLNFRNGVGAIILVERQKGLVVLPLKGEDFGKIETWQGQEALLIPGMYGLIGGGVRPHETGVQALIRETWEERGIEVNDSQIKPLGRNLKVRQIREGKQVEFSVALLLLTINNKQWQEIQKFEPEIMPMNEILELMNNGGSQLFRPFAHGAIKAMANV